MTARRGGERDCLAAAGGANPGSARERLLRAALRLATRSGYTELTVGELAEEAGVAPDELFGEFEDPEECLVAAYDQVGQGLVRMVDGEFTRAGGTWPQKLRGGLAVLLGLLAIDPATARLLAIEAPAGGIEMRDRYRGLVQGFLPFLAEGREYAEYGEQLPEQVDLLAVGGAEAIIFEEIAAGRSRRLPELLPEILFTLLVPYVGPEEAGAEMRAARG